MTALLIGYTRVSTDAQDLTAQREGLLALGVEPGRVYIDHGLTGTNRECPGSSIWTLRQPPSRSARVTASMSSVDVSSKARSTTGRVLFRSTGAAALCARAVLSGTRLAYLSR
ncbi:Resolvase, N terminal domain [Geodermatophilus amargosae]|uniref:Resolvase, N terminal domain n=1 Tax=Geodermatophilus amargosae TaxID=1296565 RepID=A0A1I7CNQ4_9ACTN|nr:recombinase family protein [Geodermatophilus amargosae]SFU01086.1 Resolvase, N terminal domain [Geodermatophilus amargosae]